MLISFCNVLVRVDEGVLGDHQDGGDVVV